MKRLSIFGSGGSRSGGSRGSPSPSPSPSPATGPPPPPDQAQTSNSGVPSNVSAEVWAAWTAHWSTEDFKKKSKQSSVNRMTEVSGPGSGPSKHTCGSKAIRTYEREMTQQMGKSPNMSELFLHTHTKNHDGVTFIDKRSLDYSTKYKQAMEMRQTQTQTTSEGDSSSPAPTPAEVDPDDVYMELASQKKKKRLYGAGFSTGRAKSISSSYSSAPQATPTSHHPDFTMDSVNAAIQHAIDNHETKMSHRFDGLATTMHGLDTTMQSMIQMMQTMRPNQSPTFHEDRSPSPDDANLDNANPDHADDLC